jgi:hypothetical protein
MEQREQAQAFLEELAQQEEPEVLKKKECQLLKAQDEYREDVKGFDFRCTRLGNWLQIYIARKRNALFSDQHYTPQDFSTVINLQSVKTIHLEQGHVPDCKGEVDYSVFFQSDKTEEKFVPTPNFGESGPGKGYHWGITPELPYIPNCRPLFMLQTAENSRFVNSYSILNVQFKTKDFPRPAKDDKIVFTGVDAILFVPALQGQRVFEEILSVQDSLPGLKKGRK